MSQHDRQRRAMPDTQNYIRRILTSSVYDVAIESPLDPMRRLSQRIGTPVFLKREDLQPVYSFKLRGAYNKVAQLSAEERARGVICASAGNHAQGVALATQKLGIRSVIVMPRTTPGIKVAAVRNLGGEVVLFGDAFDDARRHAMELEREQGLVFVHPYDDPDVIAGQGTVAVELLRQHPGPLEAVFVPIGGGGLASGIALYIKFLRPNVKVIGVEPDDAASMKAAIAAGERVVLPHVGLFADGVAVAQAGVETFRICRERLDGIITVSGDEICAAIKDIFDDTRAIAEPAGALALAGLKRYRTLPEAGNGPLIAINSGANLNFDRLQHVAERAQVGERSEALIAVTIPERPGSYRQFIRLLGDRQITEFNYRYAAGADAHIFVGVQLRDGEREREQILALLKERDYPAIDLSDNELAKLHVRHMVGGRAASVGNELVYRFEFPERPGALLRFLEVLRSDWNISMFHYRNHGTDFGRVLAGIQVEEADRPAFAGFLEELGYPWWEETDNPAYRLFLDGS
ncbi:threonine ammonia-lyase, biosynthetic [Pseudochelatococcus lubricantis]